MANVDYDTLLQQLHVIQQALQHENAALRRRCVALEARFDALPYHLYNRVVNRWLFGSLRALRGGR